MLQIHQATITMHRLKAGKAAKKRFKNSMDYNLLGVAWMIVELLA